jgi:hypothetical protein
MHVSKTGYPGLNAGAESEESMEKYGARGLGHTVGAEGRVGAQDVTVTAFAGFDGPGAFVPGPGPA